MSIFRLSNVEIEYLCLGIEIYPKNPKSNFKSTASPARQYINFMSRLKPFYRYKTFPFVNNNY